MQKIKLDRFNEAPASGYMLAYTIKEVILRAYDSLEDVRDYICTEDLLELHLFDSDKEYRAIKTTSKRFKGKNGMIEHIAEFKYEKDNTDNIYIEKCQIEDRFKIEIGREELSLLNLISYDENGTLHIDDYRLVMGGN